MNKNMIIAALSILLVIAICLIGYITLDKKIENQAKDNTNNAKDATKEGASAHGDNENSQDGQDSNQGVAYPFDESKIENLSDDMQTIRLAPIGKNNYHVYIQLANDGKTYLFVDDEGKKMYEFKKEANKEYLVEGLDKRVVSVCIAGTYKKEEPVVFFLLEDGSISILDTVKFVKDSIITTSPIKNMKNMVAIQTVQLGSDTKDPYPGIAATKSDGRIIIITEGLAITSDTDNDIDQGTPKQKTEEKSQEKDSKENKEEKQGQDEQ